jgi:prevent-host-death family protein
MKPRKGRPGSRVRETVGVADFKARCLELVENVGTRGARYVITKHGKPVARVGPVASTEKPLKGLFREQLTVSGDIVNVDWTKEWEASR